MVWLSYRILRHTCQRPFTHIRFTVRFGTLSLFQSGVWHIHDHGTPLRCTFTAFVSVYPAQVVHPVLCFTSYARYRHIAFAPPVGIHIYRSSFYLFLWQPCGCICWHSRLEPDHPTTSALQVPKSTFHLLNILHLLNLNLNLILFRPICLQTTPMLSRCTAATVNSCFIVRLLPGACFLRHSQGSRLFYLLTCVRTSHTSLPSLKASGLIQSLVSQHLSRR